MSNWRFTHLTAVLLLACLPAFVFAQDEEAIEPAMMGGSGATTWILKGNKIYYLKWDRSFEQAQIYGPRELDNNDDAAETLRLQSSGNFAWVLRDDEVFFVQAKREGSFVTLEVERPEELPDADSSGPVMMAGSGSMAWVLKGNSLFYLKWDASYGKAQIYGPEELPANDYGPSEPVLMHGTGNAVWVLRGNEVFYVAARVDGAFVDIEIERPEELPD